MIKFILMILSRFVEQLVGHFQRRGATLASKQPSMVIFPAGRYRPTTMYFPSHSAIPIPNSLVSFQTTLTQLEVENPTSGL